MEAIVLAGGLGTRLRQVVADSPKPMAPIAGRPFLATLLGSLAQKGFSRVILSLGYKAEQISSYFGPRFAGLDLMYVVEEQPLGTGGAIRLALEEIAQDHIFVFNGDTYIDIEAQLLENQWQATKRQTVVASHVSDTRRYGRLVIQGQRIIQFSEKGISGPGIVNAGVYVLKTEELEKFPLNQRFSLESDYLLHEVRHGVIDVFITGGMFIDIGIPEDYARAQVLLADL